MKLEKVKTVITREVVRLPLTDIPSGRSFTDKKNEEKYLTTKPVDMSFKSRTPNKASQLSFYYRLLNLLGSEIKGSIKHTKDPGQSIPVHGCPEQIRESCYKKYLNLSKKKHDRKNWYVELEAA